MRPDEIWEGHGVKERSVRALVTPLSWLYAFGWQVYLAIYDFGFKKAVEPHSPVLCIGSLLVGGSGKSPLTLYITKILLGLGKSVVIGCSGYGAPHSKDATIAPPGPLRAAEWGDEPSMFRWLLPDVPLVVGRNRVMAAQLVHENFPDAVLLMDDGFQHLPLKKKFSLIIDDGTNHNRACLPAGPYREPRHNRKRATKVVPDDYTVTREAMFIVSTAGERVMPTEYSILCALGQPSRFVAALQDQFPNQRIPTPLVLLQDHDPLTAPELWQSLPKELPIVVTAKDWVKLRDRSDVSERTFLVARQEVRLEPRAEFETWVERSFNE